MASDGHEDDLAKELKRTLSLGIIVFLGWTAIALGNVIWEVRHEHQDALAIATNEARSHYNKDSALRLWATSHGGIYVPATERTPPNPYLKHIPERDILTPSGKKLTLMNPAYMLRQFMTDYSDLYNVKGKITSLELINPINAPDAWEEEALQAFLTGTQEQKGLSLIEGEQYLRFMKPIIVDSGCLKCHAHQGYKVGDVRGGVSIAVPLAPYLEYEQQVSSALMLSHGIVWVLVSSAILAGTFQRRKRLTKILELQTTLSESEKRLSYEMLRLDEIIWGTNVGTWQWNLVTDEITLNERCAEIFGYSLAELTPVSFETWKSMVHPDDSKIANEFLNKNFSGELSYYENETRLRHKNGEWTWVMARGKVVEWSEDGQPLRMSGTYTDINARKQAELVSHKQALVFEHIYDGMLVTNNKAKIVDWSPSAERMFGYTAKEALGRSPTFLLQHEDAVHLTNEIIRGMGESNKWHGELTFIRKDGSCGFSETTFAPILDDQGQLVAAVGVNHDITERKRAEQKMKEREEVYHALFENNHSAMVLCDPEDGSIVDVNPAACLFYGYSRVELLQKTLFDINLLPSDELRDKMSEVRNIGQQYYFQHCLASGEVRDVEVHSGPINIHGRQLLCSMVYDITARKDADEALLKSERKHKYLAEVSPSGIFQTDIEGNATYISPLWSEIAGISPAAAESAGWTKTLHPDDRECVVLDWYQALRNGKSFRAEFRFLKPDGEVVWVLSIATPEKDDEGNIVSWVGTITDITELKQTEAALRKNDQRLTASLEEKEVLLREIHHRVKNNLQIISSLLQLQARGGDPDIAKALGESERRVKVMAHLHEKLYQSGDLQHIDTYGFLCSLIDDLRASQANKSQAISYHQDLERIELNLDQAILVGQIFSELLSNVIKHAFPEGQSGEINISLRRTSDKQIELSLSDNGVGLPADFDSNKTESLGWQLVNALSRKLGSKVEVGQTQGVGTRIRLLFDEVTA